MTDTRARLRRSFIAAILDTVERLPVSVIPSEGTQSSVDDGSVFVLGDRRCQAKFKAGKWVRPNGSPLGFEPTHWVRIRPSGEAGHG